MTYFRTPLILLLFILLLSRATAGADPLLDLGRAVSLDLLLENATRRNLISGGVILIGNSYGNLYTAAHGRLYPESGAPPVTSNTVFDAASLTKVIATAPAIMKLLEHGKISLLDPLTRWFPELNGTDHEEITIMNLLTHTSGLDDVDIEAVEPLRSLVDRSSVQNRGVMPGNRFRYADINYILLGELVKRVTGLPLDIFCASYLFRPAGMDKTGFVQSSDTFMIAPTVDAKKVLRAGVVQDLNARRLGGVAGHAGMFTTAGDLAKFATIFLNMGRSGENQLLDSKTVMQMTSPYYFNNGRVVRGLGWDISSQFSSPKGFLFSDRSYGHTGYSGTSIWIDPQHDLYVILLTVRTNYSNVRQFNQLRSDISSIAAAVFLSPINTSDFVEITKNP